VVEDQVDVLVVLRAQDGAQAGGEERRWTGEVMWLRF